MFKTKEEAVPNPQPNDYEVGYGRPPKKSQFVKGKSGNPCGRPKGSKKDSGADAFDQKITLWKNGKAKSVPVIEAIRTKVIHMALNGDHAAIKLVFQQYNAKHQPANDNALAATGSSFELSPEECAAIEQSNLLKGLK